MKTGRPKHSTTVKKAIGRKEFDTLLALTNNSKIKLAFILLYATGCRNSEILHFTTDNLKELCSTREFSLDNNNKTKTTRLLHFSNSIISKLQDIQIDTTRKYLFYKNGTDRPISISGFNKLLNDTIKKTLGPLYSTHSFRKGLVTDIINTTGNIKLAQKIAGHSSSNTTAIYIQADDNDVRNSLEAVR